MAEKDDYYILSWRVKREYKAKIDELAKSYGLNTAGFLRELTQSAMDKKEGKDKIQFINEKFDELEQRNSKRFETLETKLDIIIKLLLKS